MDTQYVREQRKIFGSEVVAWSKGVKGIAEKPVVISGPSGVGKGTLITMLMKEFPSMFGFSVSHTTRAPRNIEKDGTHYHFTERSVMENDIKDGKFLEFASVHGNLYGTSVEAVEVVADAGKVNLCIFVSLKLIKKKCIFVSLKPIIYFPNTEYMYHLFWDLGMAFIYIRSTKSSGVKMCVFSFFCH